MTNDKNTQDYLKLVFRANERVIHHTKDIILEAYYVMSYMQNVPLS